MVDVSTGLKNVFLYNDLEDYMEQPPEYVAHDENMVCKYKKAISMILSKVHETGLTSSVVSYLKWDFIRAILNTDLHS